MNLHFETHSIESMGESNNDLTHAYAAEFASAPSAPVLKFRMQSSGGQAVPGRSSSKPAPPSRQ